MIGISFEIQLIAILTAASCSILGTFLMLKNMAMISDAITHTVLLGIVLAFLSAGNLSSPLLILGGGMTGVLTVYMVELLNSSRLLKEDASIGVVFPLLFSIAIILISKYAGNVHLDVDSVLLGELAFAPLNRVEIYGISLPEGMVLTLMMFIVNSLFVIIFYKELKISTFDKGLALALGMKPVLVHYMLMTLVSVTAVTSFEAAGSILVIGFMVGPPVISRLLTNKLSHIFVINILLSVFVSLAGFYIGMFFDISIAGSISVVMGVVFVIMFLFFHKKFKLREKILKK